MTTEDLPITPSQIEPQVGQIREVGIRLSTDTIEVQVLLMDRRSAFGRTDWQITPVAGKGTAWVSEATVMGGETTTRSEGDRNHRKGGKK